MRESYSLILLPLLDGKPLTNHRLSPLNEMQVILRFQEDIKLKQSALTFAVRRSFSDCSLTVTAWWWFELKVIKLVSLVDRTTQNLSSRSDSWDVLSNLYIQLTAISTVTTRCLTCGSVCTECRQNTYSRSELVWKHMSATQLVSWDLGTQSSRNCNDKWNDTHIIITIIQFFPEV